MDPNSGKWYRFYGPELQIGLCTENMTVLWPSGLESWSEIDTYLLHTLVFFFLLYLNFSSIWTERTSLQGTGIVRYIQYIWETSPENSGICTLCTVPFALLPCGLNTGISAKLKTVWTCKNIPDRQQSARFRKTPKSAISLNPNEQVWVYRKGTKWSIWNYCTCST